MNIVVTADEQVTGKDLVAALTDGTAQLHKERANGSTRRIHFLTGVAREHAEWYANERSEGRTMKELATETLTSVAAIRRMLTDLRLTEELEDADADQLDALLQGAYELDAANTEEDAPEAN